MEIVLQITDTIFSEGETRAKKSICSPQATSKLSKKSSQSMIQKIIIMRKKSGEFFTEKHLNQGNLSFKIAQPWRKLSARLCPFHNPTQWPGVLPLEEANDMCISAAEIHWCIFNTWTRRKLMLIVHSPLISSHYYFCVFGIIFDSHKPAHDNWKKRKFKLSLSNAFR